MLKAEITNEETKVEIKGTLPEICSGLARIISAINERLTENDSDLGFKFRVMFTKGFMDGICFDDDPEHMKHYLEVGTKAKEKNKELEKLLDGLLDFLKDFNKKLEDEDEAE